jgi:hypothetical protein
MGANLGNFQLWGVDYEQFAIYLTGARLQAVN